MAKKFSQLESIRNCRQIRRDTDGEFLHQMEAALLLALRERGSLSIMEHRQALELLQQRHRAARPGEGP